MTVLGEEMTVLSDIRDEVQKIREILEANQTKPLSEKITNLLLRLPDHYRKTIQALLDCGGEATSTMISQKTGRVRPVESSYLNSLLLIVPELKRMRKGRQAWFTLEGIT